MKCHLDFQNDCKKLFQASRCSEYTLTTAKATPQSSEQSQFRPLVKPTTEIISVALNREKM